MRGGHPWLFESAITRQRGAGSPGDLAVIFDHRNRFLAVGLYDPLSPVRVRVLQHNTPLPIDRAWFAARLAAAAERRLPLLATQTTGFRLVHGENDGLPGLIVDRYADVLVLKLYSTAWLPHLRELLPALLALDTRLRGTGAALVLRFSRGLESPLLYDGQALLGTAPRAPVVFMENGLRFAADVVRGHKTGFFFDQRDNRARVAQLAAGRSVLDVFAYSGGFSLYAASGGARSVLSIDSSVPALAAARANFALNADHARVAAAQHTTRSGDAFAVLAQLAAEERHFDMVVIDPPAFAKSAAEVERALGAYTRLVRLGLALLNPAGVLVMASCSSRVAADAFFGMVLDSAADAGKPLREIARTGHALDHPIGFAEGAYLKCLFATVT